MIRLVVAAGLLAVTGASNAQVPPDIAADIRAAGPSMDPALFAPRYAPLFPPHVWDSVIIERDQAYGPHPLQKLDVYVPTERPTDAPVVLFVHGGGFTRGDKHGDYSPDNMTLWAAQSGYVGVNINYRLAPDAPWPAGTEDLAAAIAWTRENIARYGGDPDRIVLWGHSAGANHVADYVGHRTLQGAEAAAVRGAVLLSPNYALAPDGADHVYYGSDPSLNSLSEAVARLRQAPTPLFLADAEFDPEAMLTTARVLREGLCEETLRCPHYLHLRDHNHFTEGLAVGTSDQSLTGPLKAWIAERTSGPAARP